MSEIIEKIKIFVKESFNDDCFYGSEPFEYHLIPMVKRTLELSKEKDLDLELLELAAWLHDIGSAICGRENHHITGSEIAVNKLREYNYPEDKIELIRKCILNHRGSRNDYLETEEEKIIAEADALSNFDNVAGIFKAAFVYENQNQGEAKKSTLKKLENKWKQLSPESKERIKNKYEAIKFIFGEENEN